MSLYMDIRKLVEGLSADATKCAYATLRCKPHNVLSLIEGHGIVEDKFIG